DVVRGLAEAVGANNVGQWIETQAPQDEEYRALSAAYVQLLQAQQQPQQPQQGGGAAEQNGQGNAQAETKADDDERRVDANQVAPDERAVILAVNMERRRWLERQPAGTRIDVNTAASFLRYMRDGNVADQRVVVNGEPGWETPQLGSPIFRLVANPTWTVPESIERDELARLSPAQLARRNIEREGERLVQQPGPQNALGLVKFDMENDHAIYLHDTPAKAMFGRPERHLSHGCVRVQDALGFARLLAQHDGKLEQFERALRSADREPGAEIEPTYINLERRIPVRLLYHTAYLENGQVTFAPDAYGWDGAVAEGLGLRAPAASATALQRARRVRAERQQGADFGP
ncbi:MAG TPA: L,D-transpeptidase family protein, partial [Allosphingosinicella sp.]